MNKLARWIPAIVAPVVVIGAAIAVPAIASAEGPLPSKTPAQVLALVAKSQTAAYSGTVAQSSALGLPDLSSLEGQSGGTGDDALVDLLTAAHTAKVYSDGADKQRVQVLDTLAERDVVRDGTDVWLYDSGEKSAEHVTTDAATPATAAPDVTPAQAAARLIDRLQPSTDFEVTTSDRVAGRAAYRLTLSPSAGEDTLVGRATVAVDATTGVPLEVKVYAKGATKAAESIAFSQISYGTPAASVFEFTPPKGTAVESHTLSGTEHPDHATVPPEEQGTSTPTISGDGWDAIATLPAGTVEQTGSSSGDASGADSDTDGDASALLGLLGSTPAGQGLQTALGSVLVTDDGRVLVGAVPLTALESAAG